MLVCSVKIPKKLNIGHNLKKNILCKRSVLSWWCLAVLDYTYIKRPRFLPWEFDKHSLKKHNFNCGRDVQKYIHYCIVTNRGS